LVYRDEKIAVGIMRDITMLLLLLLRLHIHVLYIILEVLGFQQMRLWNLKVCLGSMI